MKKVSIIIPVYKVEEEIKRCLNSIVQQDYNNLELILVNDASPDQSFEIAKTFLDTSKFSGAIIYESHKENSGPSVARNTGIASATGDYLFFVDSDDELISETVISDYMRLAQEHHFPDVVLGNFNRIEDGKVTRELALKERYYHNSSDIFSEYAHGKLWITPWGKLVSRQVVIENKLYFKPGIYHEDELWGFQLFRVINTLYVTARVFYLYHEKEGSITAKIRGRNLEDITTVISEMYAIYQRDPEVETQSTCVAIERARRSLLYKTSRYQDSVLQAQIIKQLQLIKLPLWATKKTSYLKQNILLRFPTCFVLWYLKRKHT